MTDTHPPLPTVETLQIGSPQEQYSWREEVTPTADARHRWRKADFIPWGSDPEFDNLYPQKIESLYLRSGYFRRITDDKADQIAGEGLSIEGPGAEACKRLFAQIGLSQPAIEQAAYDLALFNGLAFEVIWNRAHTQVVRVEPLKLSRIRVAKPDEKGESAYYYSDDWRVVNRRGSLLSQIYEHYQPLRIAAYAPTGASAKQLLYAHKYSPVTDYYPLPDAESVYEELSLGADVTAFQRRYVSNGMVSSAIVYVPFVAETTTPGEELSDTDRQRMERKRRQIVDDLTGNMKAGQLSIVWFNPYLTDNNGQPVGVPRIEKPVEEKNDEKFIAIQQESRQAALTGLGVVSRELYGIPSSGGFSSQSELLITAHELTYNKLIRPKQQVLLRAIQRLATDAGFPKVTLSINAPQPITARITPEMVKAEIFTADEFRAAYGYPPRTALQTDDTATTETTHRHGH